MIVYACEDLLFATRIGAACADLGVPARPARGAAMLRDRLNRVDDGRGCDAVSAVFVELTRSDALELIALAASHEPRPHIVAFGPHVDTARLAAAKDAGANDVMPRGRFVVELPQRIAACRGA